MATGTTFRGYEFFRCFFQKAGATLTATSATDTVTTSSPHGLTVGDIVVFSDNGGATLNELQRYFVVDTGTTTTFKISATKGGSAITVGTGTAMALRALVEVEVDWANAAEYQPQTATYTFEGSTKFQELTNLRGLNVTINVTGVPASAHAAIFGNTAITGALPGGGTNGYGYGGNGNRGVTAGLRIDYYAVKEVDGVQSQVIVSRWLPQGVLSLVQPNSQQTGAINGVMGYQFAAARVAVDLLGAAITNAATNGDFYFDSEIAS